MVADSALAVLASAYDAAPDVGDEGGTASTEATQATTEHVEVSDAGQASTETPAPESGAETVDGTPEAQTSEPPVEPFRVFANEAEYRQHLDEYAKRERGAQSALQAENKTLSDRLAQLDEEKTALERWRNEIYTRAQTEEVSPQDLVQTFVRLQGETKAEFDARRSAAAETAAAEVRRESDRGLVESLSRNAAETALLRRSLPLQEEIGKVPGLHIPTALEKAIESNPEAQRYAQLSYTAMKMDDAGHVVPDFDVRKWAAEEAYAKGEAAVRQIATKLKNELAKVASDAAVDATRPAPATSNPGAATVGYDGTQYKSSVDALAAAYARR
jgi:hypothetical protein